MRHYLITCGDSEGTSDIIAVSFCMPVSRIPPLVAIAVGKQAYSAILIDQHKEFIVNVPEAKLKKEIYYCGYHSGRDVEKFKETGLTPGAARLLKIPVIEECVAFIECKLSNKIDTGDKFLYIGEVVEAYAEERFVTGNQKVDFAWGEFPKKVYSTRPLSSES